MITKSIHNGRIVYDSDLTEFVITDAKSVDNERHVIDRGAIIYCHSGHAAIQVNFDKMELKADNVLMLFPGDTVCWVAAGEDFSAEILRFESSLMREASHNMEHAVYRELKDDRICDDERIAVHVGRPMFGLLRFYFGELYCPDVDRIVTLQLTTFFLGFYDYITTEHPHRDKRATSRTEELFREFMELIEDHYLEWHEVSDYADAMNITRKYLGLIVAKKTELTPKRLIDEYIVLQLKLRLRSQTMTMKQIAAQFHFTDMSFFSRYFRAHTGMTPAQWAKRQ